MKGSHLTKSPASGCWQIGPYARGCKVRPDTAKEILVAAVAQQANIDHVERSRARCHPHARVASIRSGTRPLLRVPLRWASRLANTSIIFIALHIISRKTILMRLILSKHIHFRRTTIGYRPNLRPPHRCAFQNTSWPPIPMTTYVKAKLSMGLVNDAKLKTFTRQWTLAHMEFHNWPHTPKLTAHTFRQRRLMRTLFLPRRAQIIISLASLGTQHQAAHIPEQGSPERLSLLICRIIMAVSGGIQRFDLAKHLANKI